MELDRPVVLTEKTFFTIAEVAKATGVKAHVLRYWESQFSVLQPNKSRGNRRQYRKEDIDTILLIKDLIHRQKFSLAGARKYINQLTKRGTLKEALEPNVVLKETQIKALVALQNELLAFRRMLSGIK